MYPWDVLLYATCEWDFLLCCFVSLGVDGPYIWQRMDGSARMSKPCRVQSIPVLDACDVQLLLN